MISAVGKEWVVASTHLTVLNPEGAASRGGKVSCSWLAWPNARALSKRPAEAAAFDTGTYCGQYERSRGPRPKGDNVGEGSSAGPVSAA